MSTLIGTTFPTITLPSTTGRPVDVQSDRTVVFFYPYTGRPGHPDPEGWDHIPGAHGSTPQAVAFSAFASEFETLGAGIVGISFQGTDWQQEFVDRQQLKFPLHSDAERKLSTALSLQTFRAGGEDYLVRRTLVVNQGLITHDFSDIPFPENNARDVLRALQS